MFPGFLEKSDYYFHQHWTMYEKNFNKSSPMLQKYTIKMLTGWLPVFHQVNKTTPGQTMCPMCQNDETISHMFHCQHHTNWHKQCEEKLHNHLLKQNAPPELTATICHHIHKILTEPAQHQHFKIFAGLLQHHQHNIHEGTSDMHGTLKLSKWFSHQGYEL